MLVVLATTFVALLVSAVALLSYEMRNYLEFAASDIVTQADLVARTSAPALSFNDPKAANDTLRLLESRSDILAAAIYTADGALFATYSRDRDSVFPNHSDVGGPRVDGNELTLFHPILEGGERIGTVYVAARHDVHGRLEDYVLILSGVMVLSFVVAALISVWLQGSVTQPLLAVTDTARKIIDRRDFTLRARRTTDDEIGVLVDAFNAMLAEVEERTDALETANHRLSNETDERRSAETALRLADQRKDEFLAMLAHELRNPLAPMVNALALVDSANAGEPVKRRALQIIERQLAHMVRLVDDLLDVSRITRGKLVIRKQPVELASVIESALDTVRPLLESRGHELTVSVPPQPVRLQADPVRLSQVFSNLLNNAAKYTEQGGHIALTAAISGGAVRVTIADDGIGIAPDTLPGIFQMFAQGNHSAARSETGLGVGLALARELIELHAGSIRATSAGTGRGSTFTVMLPLMSASADEPAGAPYRPHGRDRAQHRVLLVDDNVDFAESLALLLQGLDHDVRVAHDAGDALAIARGFRPQYAFLDIGLPGVNGYELARQLRAQAETASTVLVAISGWGQDQDRRAAAEAGFAMHLVKPVGIDEVAAALGALDTAARKTGSD